MNEHKFFPTPGWLAQLLVERHFPHLGAGDVVVDAGCGTGEFLTAVPPEIDAYGIEIDAGRAAIARATTGRTIVLGDFLAVDLPRQPTVFLGNPPFEASLIAAFLARARRELPDEGRVGWILPAYVLQSSRVVVRMSHDWSIACEMIPRNIFGRIREPLTFAIFTKNRLRRLVGLALYHEVEDWRGLGDDLKKALGSGRPNWRAFVEAALRRLGGRASLDALYRAIETRRPSPNPFWREKVRQVCQDHFARVERGVYELKEAA